jgi:hypothetical protein
MIAVLFSAARIARSDLKVSRWIRADPHFVPSGRYDELADSFELGSVSNDCSVETNVGKAAAVTLATDARCCIRHIAKAGCFRGFDVLVRGNHGAFESPGTALVVALGVSIRT